MLFQEFNKQGYPAKRKSHISEKKNNWLGLFLCYIEFAVSLKDKANRIFLSQESGKEYFR